MAGLNLLVTGKPGVGKTTLVVRTVERLRDSLRLAGFTTDEVRDPAGDRVGFDIVTVDGNRGELVRTDDPSHAVRRRRICRYLRYRHRRLHTLDLSPYTVSAPLAPSGWNST